MNYNILMVCKCEYNDFNRVEKHSHDYYHMVLITGGNGYVFIDDEIFSAQKNAIVLAHFEKVHYFKSSPGSRLHTLEIKFTIHDKKTERLLENVPCYLSNSDGSVKPYFNKVLDEATNQDFIYEELMDTILHELILNLIRISQKQFKDNLEYEKKHYKATQPTKNRDLDEIVAYIKDNSMNKITLNQLCNKFAMSQTSLSRIFKQHFGISPIRFINEERLRKAKELLAYSELNVTEVSEKVGFQSIHYFSRIFNAYEGVSPVKYRENIQGSVYIPMNQYFNHIDFDLATSNTNHHIIWNGNMYTPVPKASASKKGKK